MSFVTVAFAVGGLIAAAGPIIIHLLNRRRFRTVEWAAMDFLRLATQRNRRVMRFRDVLLLTLRVLALVAFGLALAQPFFSTMQTDLTARLIFVGGLAVAALGCGIWMAVSTGDKKGRSSRWIAGLLCVGFAMLAGFQGWSVAKDRQALAGDTSSSQPLHAVIVLDNSLSMGYITLGGTLLDDAKKKAKDFIDRLPSGSRVTVLPLCDSRRASTANTHAHRSRDAAREAIDRVEVVDRAGRVADCFGPVRDACDKEPDLTEKRIVFFGDQQRDGWPKAGLQNALKTIPELQVVQIPRPGGADGIANIWVSDLRIPDGVADIDVPTRFTATLRCIGTKTVNNVRATLYFDGTEVAGQTVELEPGQAHEITFRHKVDIPPDPGLPRFMPASVKIEATENPEADRLVRDNERHLIVPVVAGLPVVFIDELGADEETEENLGDTFVFRRLLVGSYATKWERENDDRDVKRQVIRVVHVSPAFVDRDLLKNARLVVVAGVADLSPLVGLLREYVEQGGQLVLVPGETVSPATWSATAWKDGAGILPLPLEPNPIGRAATVESETKVETPPDIMGFDTKTLLEEPIFSPPGNTPQALADLYAAVEIYKAIAVSESQATTNKLLAAEKKRLQQIVDEIEEIRGRMRTRAEKKRGGTLTDEDRAQEQSDEQRLRELKPNWLGWSKDDLPTNEKPEIEAAAKRTLPKVMGRLKSAKLPFLVSRSIGKGRVRLFTTALSPDPLAIWNTLPPQPAILILVGDVLRSMLAETLPDRTFPTAGRRLLPADGSRQFEYRLDRPTGETETIEPQAMAGDTYALSVPYPEVGGIYRVSKLKLSADSDPQKVGEVIFSVTGPEGESEFASLTEADFNERIGDAKNVNWLTDASAISLSGAAIRNRGLWQMFLAICLGCLLAEMLVLAIPKMRGG